ncbi:MAG: nitroreductase family protein [Candidatus Omnitrophica bacterium]|nr:nitroreductase family protein [Candidatus Omnitrophota bacterium]
MVTIEVNKKSCKGDGRCVEICPIGVLTMNKTTHVPEFIPGGAERCINCGHCFAFCPPGAIKLSAMSVESAMKLEHAKLPSAEQVELLLKGRRSVRTYKDEPVPKESVEKLLDIARYAPSGINRQPVNWAVIMGKEKVRELGGLIAGWMEGLVASANPMAEALRFDILAESWKKGEDRICRSAPCVIIAYGLKDDPLVPQSCTIAGEYLELAAFGLGLGACWAGYVSMAVNMSDDVRKFTGISHRAQAGAAMMLGHPKYRYSRIPLRDPLRVMWK